MKRVSWFSILAPLVAALSVGCSSPVSSADPPQSEQSAIRSIPITNFAKVSQGIYRSAQPHDSGIRALASAGFRTVIDLQSTKEDIKEERALAQSLGMKFVSNPMNADEYPDEYGVNRVLDILADSSNYPVLVHCRAGKDRTGLIIGLHRVFSENWAPSAAYSEMLSFNFDESYRDLVHYFTDATGYTAHGH